jgi:hypothetical protein
MNGLARWKANRIRREIYLEHLKHTNTSSSGARFGAANQIGSYRRSVLVLEKKPAARSKKNRSLWIILPIALLAPGVATCVWLYLGYLGTHA